MIDQDRLKSHVDDLIAHFKPCNRIILACIPATLFGSYKQMEGFTVCGPDNTECYFAHAPWFRMLFNPSVRDFALRGGWDAPQPKALRMTNLKARWK